jgi:hypothetical protein
LAQHQVLGVQLTVIALLHYGETVSQS